MALILMIAREGRVLAGFGRQVRSRGRDRLDAGLLVIGDDRHRVARLFFCGGRRLFDELHLAIDAQNIRHLFFELRVAAFQVIADFVRLDLPLVEDVAQRALSQFGEAGMPVRRSVLPRMAGEKSRRPQFVRIAEFFGLAAGEIRNPCPGLGGDPRLPAGPPPADRRPAPARSSAEQSDDAPPSPAPPQRTTDPPGKPAASAPARPDSPFPFATAQPRAMPPSPPRQSPVRTPAADPPSPSSSFPNQTERLQARSGKMNPTHTIGFMESMN